MSSNYRLNGQNLKYSFELLDYNQEKEIDVSTVLDNLQKLGYDKTHPELFDLIHSLGDGKINYSDYVTLYLIL